MFAVFTFISVHHQVGLLTLLYNMLPREYDNDNALYLKSLVPQSHGHGRVLRRLGEWQICSQVTPAAPSFERDLGNTLCSRRYPLGALRNFRRGRRRIAINLDNFLLQSSKSAPISKRGRR